MSPLGTVLRYCAACNRWSRYIKCEKCGRRTAHPAGLEQL